MPICKYMYYVNQSEVKQKYIPHYGQFRQGQTHASTHLPLDKMVAISQTIF